MRKCDLCYDRTSLGLKPMCAIVCPSGALFYGTPDEIVALRRARPQSRFVFGDETLQTRNHLMVAPGVTDVVVESRPPTLSPAERQMEEALC